MRHRALVTITPEIMATDAGGVCRRDPDEPAVLERVGAEGEAD